MDNRPYLGTGRAHHLVVHSKGVVIHSQPTKDRRLRWPTHTV